MVIDELRRESMGYSELEIISGVLEISLNTLVKIKNGQPVDMAMASFGRFRDNPRPLTGLK